MNKKLIYFLLVILSLLIYVYSFNDIELICDKPPFEEIYLLNYTLKANFKDKIYSHNKNIKLEGIEFKRVYLKNNIFEIPDFIFNDKIDYKKKDCAEIDNMDIYCIVNFRKMENGKIEIYYNFLDYGDVFKVIK